jgi:hypothetical protein
MAQFGAMRSAIDSCRKRYSLEESRQLLCVGLLSNLSNSPQSAREAQWRKHT